MKKAIKIFLISVLFLNAHSGFCQNHSTEYSFSDTIRANRIIKNATDLIEAKKFDLLLSQLDTAKAIYLDVLGERSKEIGNVYFYTGKSYYKKYNFYEAIKQYQKALSIAREYSSEGDLNLATILNDLGICNDNIGVYAIAMKYYKEALAIREKVLPPDDLEIGRSYLNIGVNHLYTNQYKKAIEYHHKALEINLSKEKKDSATIATIYSNFAVMNNIQSDYQSALDYGYKSLQLRKALFGNNAAETAASLINIGNSYSDIGKFDKAVQYYEKAIDIRLKHFKGNHPSLISPYENLGRCYFENENFEKGLIHSKKSLSLLQEFYGDKHPYNVILNLNLGSSFLDASLKNNSEPMIEKSINHLNRAQQLAIEIHGEDHFLVAFTYGSLASISSSKGDYNKAIEQSLTSLKILETLHGEAHKDIGKEYSNLGNYYRFNRDFEKAEDAYLKSLNTLNFTSIDSLENINAYFFFLNSIYALIPFYHDWYMVSGDDSKLQQANEYVQNSLKAQNYIFQNLSNQSKKTLFDQSQKIFNAGIRTNLDLFKLTNNADHLTKSFDYSESAKSFLLYEAMQESEALAFANIPEDILKSEYNYRLEISQLEKERQQNMDAGLSLSDSIVSDIASKLFDCKHKYEDFKTNLESKYPGYYKAKYDLSTISLKEVQQKLLKSDQSLLEYFIGDSSSYLLLINPDTFLVHEIPMDFPLNNWVSSFRKGLTKYHTSKGHPKSMLSKMTKKYVSQGQQLYQKLIAPVAPLLNQEVIIIPDGELGYVPFEILLTEKPAKLTAFHSYPYLLKKHNISYCYSATLLQEMTQRRHPRPATKKALSIAPFFKGDIAATIARVDSLDLIALRSDTLNALPFSGDEAAKVAKITTGDQWLGKEATLENFVKKAVDYRILHLSTHGIADDKVGDYAYLAFGDPTDENKYEKLFIRDIYNIPLNADMVVLSACRTAYGKLQKGEGIISMARAFAYAGAKSIITSHWSVDDKSTGVIMEHFYKNLNSGKSKSEALQDAKLQFIESNKGLKAHPFFWAAFVGIGDMTKMQN